MDNEFTYLDDDFMDIDADEYMRADPYEEDFDEEDDTGGISEREYIRSGGLRCPNCGSYDIRPDISERLSGPMLLKETECNDCGFEWFEVWQLQGYRLEEPSYASTVVVDTGEPISASEYLYNY